MQSSHETLKARKPQSTGSFKSNSARISYMVTSRVGGCTDRDAFVVGYQEDTWTLTLQGTRDRETPEEVVPSQHNWLLGIILINATVIVVERVKIIY